MSPKPGNPPPGMTTRHARVKLRLERARLGRMLRESWYRHVRSHIDHLVWSMWDRDWLRSDRVITERNACSHLGDMCLIEVPVSSITHYVLFGRDTPKRRFIWSGDWAERALPFTSHHRYRMLEDIWQHRHDLESSETYRQLLGRIHAAKPRVIANKNLYLDSPEAILHFLQMQADLFDSLSKHGIQRAMAPDDPTVAVGRDGQLHKTHKGRKRTAAARILGLERMTVRIAYLHEHWVLKHRQPHHQRRSDTIRAALHALSTGKSHDT